MIFTKGSDKINMRIFNYILTIVKKDAIKNISKNAVNNDEIVKEEVSMEQHKIYNVLDVARYVVEYSLEKGTPISQIQLQKIIYYVQATFLVKKNGIPCFNEAILNWAYGPVVREVYDEFRYFGPRKITSIPQIHDVELDHDFKFIYNTVSFDSSFILDTDKRLIELVVNRYGTEPPFSLVEKTHSEGPWLDTQRNDEITKELLYSYYSSNLSELGTLRVN